MENVMLFTHWCTLQQPPGMLSHQLGSRFEENGWKVVWTSGIFRPVYEPFSTYSGSNTTAWCWSGRTANCRKTGHRSSANWSYKRTQVAQLVKWKWDNSRRRKATKSKLQPIKKRRKKNVKKLRTEKDSKSVHGLWNSHGIFL